MPSSIHIGSWSGRKWPLRLRVAFARAERLASRPVDDIDSIRVEDALHHADILESLLAQKDSSTWGVTGEAFALAGYLRALGDFVAGRHFEFVMGCLPFASGAYMNHNHYKSIHSEPLMSNAFFLLGMEYLRFASWKDASEYFAYSMLTASDRAQKRTAASASVIMGYRSGDQGLVDAMDNLVEDLLATDPEIQAIRTLAHPAAARRFRTLSYEEIARQLGTVPTDGVVRYLLIEQSCRRLLDADRFADAERLTTVLEASTAARKYDWARALCKQIEARCAFSQDSEARALALAREAWKLSMTLRLQSCEPSLRAMVWTQYADARRIALECALRSGEPMAMAEMLEEDRFRSSVVATVEFINRDDSTGNAGTDFEASQAKEKKLPKGEGSVPQAMLNAWGDIFRANSLASLSDDVEPPTSADQLAVVSTVPLWFGLAQYSDSIYWTVLEYGICVESGVLDLAARPQLRDLLEEFRLEFGTQLPLQENIAARLPEVDIYHELQEWGTAEERITCGLLGSLLPDSLVERLRDHGKGAGYLTISVGSGLPPLPWPIFRVCVDGREVAVVELIAVRQWLSSSVSGGLLPTAGELEQHPLRMTIDNVTGDLVGGNLETLRTAERSYSGPHLGGDESVLDYARRMFTDHPPGVFFYRGHMHSDADPASAYIDIPIADGFDADDERIFAGQLFGRLPDGTPWFPLPQRAVLSCCASAGSGLLGSESMGFVAACVVGGGALEVVGTSIDIVDSPFTAAFEDQLALVAQMPEPLVFGLHRLQRKMYGEWCTFSLRGGIAEAKSINYPHPLIWAMYQSY